MYQHAFNLRIYWDQLESYYFLFFTFFYVTIKSH